MRGDWKEDAMEYRDLDRAAQERAERELGAVMGRLAESVADLPDAEVLSEAREAGDLMRGYAADRDRLRAVWRAVVGFFGDSDLPEEIVDAAVDAGLAERMPFDEDAHAEDPDLAECEEGDIITVLTPDGERLVRGGT